jgi:NitT/TauT family transport system substrate-binding protein
VVNVAWPYIPNVQFAPYYVASSQGYYTDAGLEVTFEYMFENEAVQLVAQEKADFGFLSGISVLLARQSDMPVVTVATITHEFPVVFFSTADTPLAGVQDLREHRIGIPGQFGASYYGLLAVLYANDMQESDLELHDIGFNQVSMLLEDKVDVAVGYAMNEPVQLREMGEDVSVLHVADIYPLVSDGIITHEEVIANDPDLVRSFVQATLQGVEYLLANPDEAFEISLEHIPEADLGDVDFQRKVFDASIPYWQSDAPGLSNVELWTQTHTFLLDSGLLSEPVEIESSVTNEFVE